MIRHNLWTSIDFHHSVVCESEILSHAPFDSYQSLEIVVSYSSLRFENFRVSCRVYIEARYLISSRTSLDRVNLSRKCLCRSCHCKGRIACVQKQQDVPTSWVRLFCTRIFSLASFDVPQQMMSKRWKANPPIKDEVRNTYHHRYSWAEKEYEARMRQDFSVRKMWPKQQTPNLVLFFSDISYNNTRTMEFPLQFHISMLHFPNALFLFVCCCCRCCVIKKTRIDKHTRVPQNPCLGTYRIRTQHHRTSQCYTLQYQKLIHSIERGKFYTRSRRRGRRRLFEFRCIFGRFFSKWQHSTLAEDFHVLLLIECSFERGKGLQIQIDLIAKSVSYHRIASRSTRSCRDSIQTWWWYSSRGSRTGTVRTKYRRWTRWKHHPSWSAACTILTPSARSAYRVPSRQNWRKRRRRGTQFLIKSCYACVCFWSMRYIIYINVATSRTKNTESECRKQDSRCFVRGWKLASLYTDCDWIWETFLTSFSLKFKYRVWLNMRDFKNRSLKMSFL